MKSNFKRHVIFSKYSKYFKGEKYDLDQIIYLAKEKKEKFEDAVNYICDNINSFNSEETKKAVRFLIKTDDFSAFIFSNADTEHKNMILNIFDSKKSYNYSAMCDIYNYVLHNLDENESFLDKIIQITLKYTNNIECLLKLAKKSFDHPKAINLYTQKIESFLNECFTDNSKREISINLFRRIITFYTVYMGKRYAELKKIYIKAIQYYINDGINNSNFSSLLSFEEEISLMGTFLDSEHEKISAIFKSEIRKAIVNTKNKKYIALYIYETCDYELLIEIFDTYEKFINYCVINSDEMGIDVKKLNNMFNNYVDPKHFSYVDDRIDDYLSDKTQSKMLKH